VNYQSILYIVVHSFYSQTSQIYTPHFLTTHYTTSAILYSAFIHQYSILILYSFTNYTIISIHITKMSIKIVALLGSLRTESYTKKLLLYTQQLIQQNHKDVVLEIYDNIGLLPFVNEDLESDYYQNNKDVIRFKDTLRSAHGILFATPEYNFSVPGVLKNAIDIATRPYNDNVLVGKPFGIISSSPGVTGGIRSQMAIRNTMFAFGGFTTGYPEFILGGAYQAFTPEGTLKNEQSTQALNTYINNYTSLVRKNLQPVSKENTATDVEKKSKENKDQTN